jgi:uncharacterized protein (TIGR02588 family)
MTETPRDQPTPLTEWIAAATGAAIATGLIGYLAWDGLLGGGSPPDLRLVIEAIAPTSEGFRVDVVLSNAGAQTAADVVVKSFASEIGDEGEITFDFVPGQSLRRGTLLFRERPDPDRLDLRVVGYREP